MTKTQTVVCASVAGALVVAVVVWTSFFIRGRLAMERLVDTLNRGDPRFARSPSGTVVAYAVNRRAVASRADKSTETPLKAAAAVTARHRA
jgi:hypothetical protein